MTTANGIDWSAVLVERLTSADPDVLRELLATFIHLMRIAVIPSPMWLFGNESAPVVGD
jgi:hypothetical protein